MGAGNSKSRSNITTVNNQNFITKNEINSINDKLTNITSETMIDTSKTCSNSSVLENVIDFSDSVIKGDFTLDNIKLDQSSLTTLNCVQASTARVDVATALITTIMEELNTNTDTALLSQMDSQAESAASLGLFAFGNTDSKSNVEQTINTNVLNENTKNLQNLVETVVSTKVTEQDIQECINKVNQIQGIDASGAIIGGSVNISNYESVQVASNISDCIQSSSMISSMTQDIADTLGIQIIDEIASTSETQQEGTSVSEASTGLSGLALFGFGFIIVLIVAVIGYVLLKKKKSNIISEYYI